LNAKWDFLNTAENPRWDFLNTADFEVGTGGTGCPFGMKPPIPSLYGWSFSFGYPKLGLSEYLGIRKNKYVTSCYLISL
jgi:hypothetical protein